jgi:tetratricopeptide (TPR) repeat protein
MPATETVHSEGHSRTSRHNRNRWKRILFPAAAVMLALLPFLLLEGALRIFGAGTSPGAEADAAGFGASRLFELDEEEELYQTARHRLLFFGAQQFAARKSQQTFRIFGLGGSTVYGHPYEAGTCFLKWLELELNGRDSSRIYESVNCGGISYASYRLTKVLDEVLHYDPDLIVVATGHNEFLEDRSYHEEKNRSPLVRWAVRNGNRLHTVALARQILQDAPHELNEREDSSGLKREVDTRLDARSGYGSYRRDEEWRESVVDQYEDSLRAMVKSCRDARVPLILVNLGDNLRDCPPFKSEHRSDLPAESLQQWQELFDRAWDAGDSDPAEALELYGKAEAIDDQYALLAFRMARCHDRLGNTEQARAYYQRARQLDICPLRMVNELHEDLKRIARETGTPLVDAEALAAGKSPGGIPGNNCFMDHVHPDIGSHQEIGKLLADQAEAMGLVSAGRPWAEAGRRRAYRIQFRRLGPSYLANGRRRVGWLENWARAERLDDEARPVDARGHLHLGKRLLDFGEIDEAWGQFLIAIDEEPQRIEEVFGYAFDLFSGGRTNLAEQVLVRLHHEPRAESYRPVVELACLIAALDAGNDQQAEIVAARYGDSIEKAGTDPKLGRWITALPVLNDRLEQLIANRASLAADDSSADPFLHSASAGRAPVATKAAERPTVSELLDKAILRNPGSAPLYLTRARLRFSKQDYEAALDDVTRSIELAPDNTDALKFRAILHIIQDDAQAAVDDLTAAISLDANDPELLRMRAAAYRRTGNDEKAAADLEAAEKLGPGE